MRRYKGLLAFALDIGFVILSYLFALVTYSGFSYVEILKYTDFYWQLIVIIIAYGLVFTILSYSKLIWSYISIEEGIKVVVVNLLASSLVGLLVFFNVLSSLPYSVIVIAFFMASLAHAIMRFSYRSYSFLYQKFTRPKDAKNILIYGGGQAGGIIIREFAMGSRIKGNIVGVIDDNPELQGRYVYDKKVLGYDVNP